MAAVAAVAVESVSRWHGERQGSSTSGSPIVAGVT